MIDSTKSRGPPQALSRPGQRPEDWNQSPGGPGVKAHVQAGPKSGPRWDGPRVGLATANERATGRNPLCEPGGSRMGEGQVHTSGPDQGRPKLSDGLVKQGAKSAWDRITAPSLADCGRCLRLGEVREEWILTRSLSARRWEADRCVHMPCH